MIVYRCAECPATFTNDERAANSHEQYRHHATIRTWQPDPEPPPDPQTMLDLEMP